MKIIASAIFILALISLTPAYAAQDSIEGYWEGALTLKSRTQEISAGCAATIAIRLPI